MGQRAGDIARRYNGTLGPKSDIPSLLAGITTLAQVPVGQSFFGTALPAPTLSGGFVPPSTLEEALEALAAECSRLR